eukprot:PITA_08165
MEVESVLRTFLPGWSFQAIDAVGHSGGLAFGVKDGRMQLNSLWGMDHVLGMEIASPELGAPIMLLNIYGPCQGREQFWNNLLTKEIINNKRLILGGDLNFSIGFAEAWGPSAREDPLSDFFSNLLNSHNLLDVNLIKAKPTWRNRRTGEGRVAKRLDRFLINEDLMRDIPMIRKWIGEGETQIISPFSWRDTWRHVGNAQIENKGAHLGENLRRLKKATIEWAKARKKTQNENLSLIDQALRELEEPEADGYLNQESKEKILNLEKQRSKILLEKEEEWRQKSRATWLKAGDENTKFFHNYAKGRKNINTIWKLKDQNGREFSTFEDLSRLGKYHFQNLFTAQGGITLAEIIRTAQSFPRFVEEEEAGSMMEEVTKDEIEHVIKSMAKDKSPEVVNESRRKGEIHPPFNATFIALIPKKEDPDSFEDFRPISLCNCIYKIIAKIIAIRLKPILSKNISTEQFGFLDGRQIHEAIGVAQETLHSIRQTIKKGAVIKIDLSKAYDRICWTYLRLLLTHLGFKLDFINWIMGCVTSVSFAVLINGAASPFFKGQRGLRQGCPLSPLLFLLVAEGLSRLLMEAKREGLIKGLEVAVNLFISHLLFVDDILLFTNGSLNEVKELKVILDIFMKATGMQINFRKSHFIFEGFNRNERAQITSVIPFEAYTMEYPFKYLGFWLKPNSYKKQDWNWLVAKIEGKINHWSYKWLSRAGRLTLVNSVLHAMPVFWAALTWIPKGTLHKIKRICSRFLWSGAKEDTVLPWVAWDKIARPKEWGGWGIKNLNDFSTCLAAKSGWRIISSDNLWTRVVKRKYIDPMPLETRIRDPNKKGRNISVVWKATSEAFKVIEQGLSWQVGNGENVKIGRDPWVGFNDRYALTQGLIRHLEMKGIYNLHQIEKIGHSSIWGQAWMSGEDLDLDPVWWDDWNIFTQELSRSNVRIKDRPDQLVWAHADSGSYTPKAGYKFLMTKKGWEEPDWWSKSLWKLKCPKKSRLFFWCLLKGNVPSWDVLQTRFMIGPSRCPLCKLDSENVPHLFLHCPFTKKVWQEVQALIKKQLSWDGDSMKGAWDRWWIQHPGGNLKNLPPIISWGVWIARNKAIFQAVDTPACSIALQSSAIFSSIPEPEESLNIPHNREEQIRPNMPWAYLDGASPNQTAGAGMVIHLNESHSISASVGIGNGSNNFAELSVLKLLLCWLIQRHIFAIQIFGDSLNVIKWVNGINRCQNYMLRPLLEEVMNLKQSFNSFYLDHIYRNRNEDADKLSKEALQQTMGIWQITELNQGHAQISTQPPFA